MRDLQRDFALDVEDAAAILGNLGHESGGFRFLQEKKPTVHGSRGGWGWAQWTGPRRRQFEAFAKELGCDPASDEANYGFLVHELRGSEKAAIPAVKAAGDLMAKVKAFEKAFERAGVKHYPSRLDYAQQALAAFHGMPAPPAPKKRAPRPKVAPIAPAPATPPALVEPAGQRPSLLRALWSRLRGRPAVPTVPVIAGTRGDPTIFYVQTALRQRAYYTRGLPDGIDGPLTRDAVAASRKDNGLGDGGIDTAFLTRLPSFPQRPVSQERAALTIKAAAAHAPELFRPASLLWKFGLGTAAFGVADEAKDSGLLDQLRHGVTNANEIMGQVQTAAGYAASAVAFVVEHRTLILIGVGIFLVLKAGSYILDGWIKVRQAFF